MRNCSKGYERHVSLLADTSFHVNSAIEKNRESSCHMISCQSRSFQLKGGTHLQLELRAEVHPSHEGVQQVCLTTQPAALVNSLSQAKSGFVWSGMHSQKVYHSVGEEALPLSQGLEEHLAFHSQDWPVPL